MRAPKMFEQEYKLCCIIWELEPIASPRLVEVCKERMGWAFTTTYTVIKRLIDKKILARENAIVTTLFTKEEVQEAQIDHLVEKTFDGSVPAFVAAFTKSRSISEKEVDAIQRMIDDYREKKK